MNRIYYISLFTLFSCWHNFILSISSLLLAILIILPLGRTLFPSEKIEKGQKLAPNSHVLSSRDRNRKEQAPRDWMNTIPGLAISPSHNSELFFEHPEQLV